MVQNREKFLEYKGELNYKFKMLNNINNKNILALYTENVDNSVNLIYDISECQRFEIYMESIDVNEKFVKSFIDDIYYLIDDIENHALNIDELLLDFEYIYIKDTHLMFMYYPGHKGDFYNSINLIYNKILDNVDYLDKELVSKVFAINQMFRRQDSIENMHDFTNKDDYILPKIDEKIFVAASNEDVNDDVVSNILPKISNNIKLIILLSCIGFSLMIILFYIGYSEILIASFVSIYMLISYIIYKGYLYISSKDCRLRKKLDKKRESYLENCDVISDYDVLMEGSASLTLIADSFNIYIAYFPFYIGSSKHNDYTINNKGIDMRQVMVDRRNGQIYLTNESSSKPIYINKSKLKKNDEVQIKMDDSIKIGGIKFRVKI